MHEQSDFNLYLYIDGKSYSFPENMKRFIGDICFEESIETGVAQSLTFKVYDSESPEFDAFLDLIRLEMDLRFDIGRVNRLRTVFIGTIIEINPQFPSDEASFLEVVCHDWSCHLKIGSAEKQTYPKRTENDPPSKSFTWKDVVSGILGRYGFKKSPPKVWPSGALDVELGDSQGIQIGGLLMDDPKIDTLNMGSRGTITQTHYQRGGTAWMALTEIAAKFDLSLFVREATIHMVKEEWFIEKQGRVWRLLYGASPEALNAADAIPLLELDIESESAGNSDKITVTGWKPVEAKDPDPDATGELRGTAMIDPAWIKELPRFPHAPVPGQVATIGAMAGFTYHEDNPDEVMAELFGFLRWPVDRAAEFARMTRAAGERVGETATEFLKRVYQGCETIVTSGDPLRFDRNMERQRKITEMHAHGIPEEAPIALTENEVERVVSEEGMSTQKQVDEKAAALLAEMLKHLTVVRGVIPGNVSILAGHEVEIVIYSMGIIGRKYSGEYVIRNVKHTIDSQGYRTSFEAYRRLLISRKLQAEITPR